MPARTKSSVATKTKAAPKRAAARAATAKASASRMTLAETMAALEKAGSAQTRKTYARHGAQEPMFGVSFATLKALVKRIGVDHELACSLWSTGNFDARNLAFKVVDPRRLSGAELDKWAKASGQPMCQSYVAHVVVESLRGREKADAWLASSNEMLRIAGWCVASAMAMVDETAPDEWFTQSLAEIEASIEKAPNAEREVMNRAVIAIGCRNPSLRKAALAAAKRIGKVEVDHGDTECKTPDAAAYIEKAWTHSTSKGFASPAAHERSREPMRLRC